MIKLVRLIVSLIIVSAISFAIAYTIAFNCSNKPVNSIIGAKIVIDPGHGGVDNGACKEGVLEDEINLAISSFLFEKIIDEGGSATITRSGDYDLASLYARNRKREDLMKRANYINTCKPDLFISIHVNAALNESIHGPMVYYRKDDENSKMLALAVSNALNEFSNLDKPIHSENYFLFRNTIVPGILIECGFISHDGDRSNLINESYQKRFASIVYEGVILYLKQNVLNV